MTQYLRKTYSPAGGTITENLFETAKDATLAALETAGSPVTIQSFGPNQRTDPMSGNGTLAVHNLTVSWIQVSGTGTVVVDISGPEYVDPKTLTATGTTVVSGTITANAGSGTFSTSTTNGALETGGNLATVVLNQTNGNQKIKPLGTLVEVESYAPTSRAAASAEASRVTGTTTLTLGQQVFYNLGADGNAAGAAGVIAYVAIKGATSGNYYAVAYAGSGGVSGTFPVAVAEKLNIVDRNSEAANAHIFSGAWSAYSP